MLLEELVTNQSSRYKGTFTALHLFSKVARVVAVELKCVTLHETFDIQRTVHRDIFL
jgi:hypothetical protein